MQPAAILDELIRSDDLPREALRAAAERRADMVPLFVEQIENYLQTGTAAYDADAPLFFIFHLLGDWREKSAYRTLARLLRCPSDAVDAALAESVTETTHRVMAAVFDGDPGPIYNIVLDEGADEYVRSRMCETLAMLAVQGRLERAEVASFLRDCWIHLQPRDGCFVWHGWQSAIAMLGLVELKEIVKQAFDRGIIDNRWLSYKDFESDLEHAVENPTEPWPRNDGEFTLFGNTIEELSTWYGFSEKAKQERARARNAPAPPLFPPSEPVTNPMRGVGRNDPCPCGSRKKYKKCCLQ
jgi:Protein of unknown function (DUF1186)/SEC-C motif